MFCRIAVCLILFIQTFIIKAESFSDPTHTEGLGNLTTLLLPAITTTALYKENDKQGMTDFLKSSVYTVSATHGMKYLIPEDRPNHKDNLSFISGHTSLSFSTSAFVHRRYGFRYAAPMYVASAMVGYTRVQSNQHHPHNVLLARVLGVAFGYLGTTYKVNNSEITLNLVPLEHKGMMLNIDMKLK